MHRASGQQDPHPSRTPWLTRTGILGWFRLEMIPVAQCYYYLLCDGIFLAL